MYRAMIVDDEETIVTGLRCLLPWEKFGCTVVATAGDGASALKLIHHHRPHLLFSDIRMPTMDGLSMIAALRSEFPLMEITILSGHPDFEYAQQAIRLGVTNYVLKPSKMSELEDALARMVQNLHSREAIQPPSPVQSTDAPTGTPAGAHADTAKDNGDSAGNFIINNAIRYMEGHYSEKLTLPDVAEQVFVSQWHLSKLISKTTGQSFNDLLNGIRIHAAISLMHDSSLKIWEISEMVGFSDVTHFSRIFKKMQNMSANEYRNNHINGEPTGPA